MKPLNMKEDLICLGPRSGMLRCETCIEFANMTTTQEKGLDSVGMTLGNLIKIIICGRIVESSIYISNTESIINLWNEFPDMKPKDVKIIKCKTCYYISFEISNLENIGSIVKNGMRVDSCYVTDDGGFYPTIDTEISLI